MSALLLGPSRRNKPLNSTRLHTIENEYYEHDYEKVIENETFIYKDTVKNEYIPMVEATCLSGESAPKVPILFNTHVTSSIVLRGDDGYLRHKCFCYHIFRTCKNMFKNNKNIYIYTLKAIKHCNKTNLLPIVEGCNIVSQSVRRIM